MSEAQSPDALKNLVLFMVALAILGTLIALAVYVIAGIPAHPSAVPLNGCWGGNCR